MMKGSFYKSLPYLLIVVLSAILCAVLNGILSIYVMKSVDAATTGNMRLFKQEIVNLLIVALLLVPSTIALSISQGLYKRKAVVSIKYNYIRGIFHKNINEFQKDNNSKYMSVLTNDINTIENSYIDGLYELLRNLVYFIVGVIIIGIVSPLALGIGIGVGVISTYISVLLSKPIEKHLTQRSDLYEKYTSYIKEILGAFHIIKSNNLNEKVKKDFNVKSQALQHKGYIIDKIYTYICSIQELNTSITIYVILGISVFIAMKGQLTIGGVVLVVTNIEKVMSPMTNAGEWIPRIFSSRILFKNIDTTLENVDKHQEEAIFRGLNSSINFYQVSFSYEKEEILKNIEIEMKKGGKYLIIGPSGGGKSTLLKLLRKYYVPKSGSIFLDNNNLMDLTKQSYFKYISNVEQQVFLFEDTLRNNITLYKDYTDEEINTAIINAGLKAFVDGLSKGLENFIYDNGKNISGGEKSRIAIARGLLQRADIIFLDEAFASLDTKVAKEIENTLLSLEGITVVNVSHVIFEETKKNYTNVFMVKNKQVYTI